MKAKTIPEHMAKHGYGPDKLRFTEFRLDQVMGAVTQSRRGWTSCWTSSRPTGGTP